LRADGFLDSQFVEGILIGWVIHAAYSSKYAKPSPGGMADYQIVFNITGDGHNQICTFHSDLHHGADLAGIAEKHRFSKFIMQFMIA
jgi:hypothetical protein